MTDFPVTANPLLKPAMKFAIFFRSTGHRVPRVAVLAGLAFSCISSVRGSPDRDGDGLGDVWQVRFGLPSLTPMRDTDGDGVSNGEEELAGTDPLDSGSAFRVEHLRYADASEREMVVTARGVAGKRYQVQEHPDLNRGVWIDLGFPVQAAADGEVALRVPRRVDADRGFYRIAVTDLDEDEDGLSAAEEAIIGTSDHNPNTHGERNRTDLDEARDWLHTNDKGIDPNAGSLWASR